MSALKNRSLYKLFEYVRSFLDYSIPKESELPASKVLLFSPNQCDWVIGCSGILLNHIKNGGNVEIVHCTNKSPEKMKESEKASSFLGVRRNHFFQFPSGKLKSDSNFCQTLIKLFDKIEPEIVFLPFWFDNHPDHIALSRALIKIRKEIDLHFTVYAYGVWTPVIPNCIFDISDQWETKKKIIECCAHPEKDYLRIAQGINQYWGAQVPGAKYAETFFTTSAHKYISLGRKILE